jgi:hypothetical protein
MFKFSEAEWEPGSRSFGSRKMFPCTYIELQCLTCTPRTWVWSSFLLFSGTLLSILGMLFVENTTIKVNVDTTVADQMDANMLC